MVDVIQELEEYGVRVKVVDPVADERDLWDTYRIKLYKAEEIKNVDATVFAVAHKEFKSMELKDIKKLYNQIWNGYPNTVDEVRQP